MIRVENGKYIIEVPEESLFQDFNPDAGRPFGSEQEAKDYEARFIAARPAPQPPAPTPSKRVLTKYEMRQRFSFSERVALYSSTDAGVRVILDDLQSVSEINLDDPAIGMSLEYLLSKGLITESKKAGILA